MSYLTNEELDLLTLEELKIKRDRILEANEWWKHRPYQDGSYEAAITYDGYYRIVNRIRSLTHE